MSLGDLVARGARFEVRCASADCTDEVTFHVRSASRGLGVSCEHALIDAEKRALTFEPSALRDAREVLTIEQGNYVAKEVRGKKSKLARCTPPFLLSRSLTERAHAREDLELDFVAYLERPLVFRFERETRASVLVDGKLHKLTALRFLACESDDEDPDESIGFLEIDAESSTLLRLSRDDESFGVELVSIRSPAD
jgi:hypothetical protein